MKAALNRRPLLLSLAALVLLVSSSPAQIPLVPPGASWRYLDDGSNQGSFWRSISFNDAGWKSGSGPFGYGNGDELTRIDPGPDPLNPHVTTYFRASFPAPMLPPGAVLQLHMRLDDGAVVYLNSTEIWRANMPDVRPGYLTPAVEHAPDDGQFFLTVEADATLLNPELNVLAVEIHQARPDEQPPDMSFDAVLFLSQGLPPFIELHPQCMTAFLGTNVEFFSFAVGATQVQWLHNDVPIPGATNALLTLTNLTRQHVGQYRMLAWNFTGTALSEPGELQLELDTAGTIRNELVAKERLDLPGLSALLMAAAAPGGCLPPLFSLSHGPAYSYSTYGATNSTSATNGCGVNGGRAKWSFFIATASERVVLRTEGSNFDTLLAVYWFNGIALVQIACDDNSGPNGTSRVEFDVVAGQTYYIAVDGVNGATGNVRLQMGGLEIGALLPQPGGPLQVPLLGRRSQDRTYTLRAATNAAAPSNAWFTVLTTNISRTVPVWLFTYATNPPAGTPRLFFKGTENP